MQEAIKLAIQTEKNVMDFYRRAAEITKNPRGKKVFNLLVITSYSIHYTKLYDSPPKKRGAGKLLHAELEVEAGGTRDLRPLARGVENALAGGGEGAEVGEVEKESAAPHLLQFREVGEEGEVVFGRLV